MKFLQKEASWDVIQPWCTLCLLVIGITTIYSAQLSFLGDQWKVQLVWAGIGLGIYLVASRVDYEFYLRHAHWIYMISVGLLLSLWTPLGVRRFGAVRWLHIGGFRIQPSELAKVAILFMTASILARSEVGEVKRSWQVLLKIGAVLLLPASLIFFQPDLGSMLALPPVVFALLLISPLSGKFFLSVLGAVLVMISIVTCDIYAYRLYLDKHQLNPLKDVGQYESHSWLPLKDYQRNRVLAFVLPQVVDPQGTGISWNLRQSLIAIGSGGIRGRGFCRGNQSKLGYLPQSVAANDFIFSVMAEEHGFMGGVIVLLLYALMIANSFRIAWMARDSFGCFIATGAGVLWMVHIGINIGMTLGLMPITGIPLPFLSYGGSFLILCCFLQGMLQSVYHYRYHYA
ncbi:MAG: rod shape-determining protein RodA [Puniceicoccales bacterium]|jgi:rod shape determining protein RodA|nr:rod shape-determining protein RodA [Puniceicoccales bacterium]